MVNGYLHNFIHRRNTAIRATDAYEQHEIPKSKSGPSAAWRASPMCTDHTRVTRTAVTQSLQQATVTGGEPVHGQTWEHGDMIRYRYGSLCMLSTQTASQAPGTSMIHYLSTSSYVQAASMCRLDTCHEEAMRRQHSSKRTPHNSIAGAK